MKRRGLTPEEQQLWNYVTRNDTRLHPNASPADNHGKTAPVAPRAVAQPAHFPYAAVHAATDAPDLSQGNYDGIDRSTANRFRKGKFPVDAVLDLHGLNREKAYKTLAMFLKNHYERGSRCVLVITGKGQKQSGGALPEDCQQGVLRGLLPQWLNDPALKPLVLAFDNARQQHGGMGAFYILLRRRRQPRGA